MPIKVIICVYNYITDLKFIGFLWSWLWGFGTRQTLAGCGHSVTSINTAHQ